MKHHVRRVAKVTAGAVFLFLGVIGLFLPGLQGLLFLVIGLSLLSSESPMAKRWLGRLRAYAARLRRAIRGVPEGDV